MVTAHQMKMPERSRISRVRHFKDLLPNDVILWCHMRAWHRVVASQDVLTSHDRPWICIMPLKSEKVCGIARLSHFLTWWPWPLTIELDLAMVQLDLHVKFLVRTSNGSVVRVLTDGHTDRQTGPILLPRPLTREVTMSFSRYYPPGDRACSSSRGRHNTDLPCTISTSCRGDLFRLCSFCRHHPTCDWACSSSRGLLSHYSQFPIQKIALLQITPSMDKNVRGIWIGNWE